MADGATQKVSVYTAYVLTFNWFVIRETLKTLTEKENISYECTIICCTVCNQHVCHYKLKRYKYIGHFFPWY